jgi:hypothetical protein
VQGRTDDQGRFRLNIPKVDAFEVQATAPHNTPYFNAVLKVAAQTDLTQPLRVELPRGVAVHGRVIQQPAGTPAIGAGVGYLARNDNPIVKRNQPRLLSTTPAAVTDDQGWFTLGVPEGPGTLIVWTASADNVQYSISSSELMAGKPGIDYNAEHAFGQLPIDVPAGVRQFEVQIPIERGVTVQGNVVGAEGTVPQTLKMTYRGDFQKFTDAIHSVSVWPLHNGHLKIRGVPPDGELLVFLLDPVGRQGKVLPVHGSDADKPLNVTLEKCGSVTYRFVDPKGKPVPGYAGDTLLNLLFLPEDFMTTSMSNDQVLNRQGSFQRYFDYLNCRDLMSDENGTLTVPALIPGAIYQLNSNFAGLPNEIKVQPGENLDLPEAVVTKPQALKQAADAWQKKQQQAAADRVDKGQ